MIIKADQWLHRQVIDANPGWFSKSNKRMFGDIHYHTYHAQSGKAYLVRLTNAWSDMFDQPLHRHYRINPINPQTFDIEPLVDDVFETLGEVKTWLKHQ